MGRKFPSSGGSAGNEVLLSYRRDKFSRIKPGNLERIERALAKRRIDVHWSTSPAEIRHDSVVLRNGGSGSFVIPNDYVFVFIGGELPTKFLTAFGIEIDNKCGER